MQPPPGTCPPHPFTQADYSIGDSTEGSRWSATLTHILASMPAFPSFPQLIQGKMERRLAEAETRAETASALAMRVSVGGVGAGWGAAESEEAGWGGLRWEQGEVGEAWTSVQLEVGLLVCFL